MSDRRKDMWRLLYNLVNRNETQLGEVFVFIDDILCKEPSLIRQSSKEATNHFQDAFILWLINKLVGTLHVEQENDSDIFEINLKIQRKLLNSCLVNRSCLFEKVVRAYSIAISQLSEAYSEVDFSLDKSTVLEITAFSIHYKELEEIDPDFSFPIIRVDCEKVEDYIQAMLQVLHHGLYVGYINYPSIFEDSILNALKALKEFGFTTKIMCIQYVGKVFLRTITLSEKLNFMFELCFRSIVSIWQYLPMWLSAQCLSQDLLDDFLDESSQLLKALYTFSDDISEKHIIESYCFQLIENIHEVHQGKSYQTLFDLSKTEDMLNLLIDFMYSLHVDNPSMFQKINPTYVTVLLKVVGSFPQVLRAITPHIMFDVNEEVLITFAKFVTLEIRSIMNNEIATDKSNRFLKEYLSFLFLLEHQFQWHSQEFKRSACKSKKGEYLNKAYNQIVQIVSESIKAELVECWMIKTKSFNGTHSNYLNTVGLLLDINCICSLLTPLLMDKLIETLIRPITADSLTVEQFNPSEVETSLEVIAQLQKSLTERSSKKIKTSLTALGKFLFSKKNDKQYILTKYTQLIPNFIVSNWLTVDIVANDVFGTVHEEDVLLNTVRALCCLKRTSEVVVAKCLSSPKEITASDYPKIVNVSIECKKCCDDNENVNLKVRSQRSVSNCDSKIQYLPTALKTFVTKQLFTNPRLLYIKNHFDFCAISHEDILDALFSGNIAKPLHTPNVASIIRKCIQDRSGFLTQLSARLLLHVTQSLKSNGSRDYQRTILSIITSSTQSGLLSEQWLYHFFKITFFYLIHPESKVVHEAILCASEMCTSNNVKPIYLWNWYKRDALILIVRLMVYVYLSKGIRLTKSLSAFTKMLGFSCVEEFVCKYYRLLVTMILPFCVKEPRCKGLIISISKITRKPIVDLFVVSFLRIYTHIYLTEDADVGNLCIELIGKCTGSSLSKLMNTDIQQTVCEFLVYYNRSPTFVMQAFRCLLPDDPSKASIKSSSQEFTEFIKLRFLGVITYFQTCLAETFFEKPLKEETLYSLGQIMRLIGSNSVTQFRFKIIAMLSFVLTINDRNMQNICLKIWNIFLHIVSIQELGPSLSRIVASLLPLIDTNTDEINLIYEFLILKNDSLLGVYIPDLYFLEGISKVKPAIRQSVARQSELSNKERGNVSEKLQFLYKQICNENLEVRIYGLNYLASFIALNRREINHMILDTIPVDPLIERIVDELIKGCRHDDRNMHLASAKCLGELGAIDPSYMSSSFSFRNSSDISLSILTDDFAIMALTELCRAYQFQKDSKYVDNFSLAIQETLSAFGISPDENKKLNIWDAIPVRMQQIMRPLLSSCYTGSKRQTKITDQPLFNSSSCRSYEEWSFAWSCRLIDLVEKEETRQLLNSYKLSMKRDSNILAIFFPYILLHVLQECPFNKTDQIFEEFTAVLNFSSREICMQTEVDTFGYKEFKSTKYSADGIVTDSRGAASESALDRFEGMETVIQTCTKLCSELIDFLQRWVGEWQRANSTGGKIIQENNNYKAVKDFLVRFNKSLISKANFNCGEYSRALLYLEEYIEEDPSERLQDQLSFLIQIHGKLMDSDSVEGAVYMKKVNLSLEEEILVNRLVDRPQETITCYEQLLSKSDAQINQDHIKGIIDCYLRMDTPETALLITDGLWQKLADQYTDDYFKECKSELLWRLGRYDELQELLEDTVVKRKTSNWNIQCAESFLLFRQPHVMNDTAFGTFVEQLNVIRSNIVGTMRSCSGITGNAYTHSYDEATRLHLLNEVEKNKHLIIQVKNAAAGCSEEALLLKVKEFFNNWDARLEVLQPAARVLESILCFRRNLLLETQRTLLQDALNNDLIGEINEYINEQIVKLWLRSIQVNRESGCLQQAQICIMKAEQYKPVTLFLAKAKLLWQKNDQANCFKLLQKNIQMLLAKCNGVIRNLDKASRIIYAEAKFLQAYYNAESMNICQELNLAYYKEAVEANHKSEKCQVHYAQYMEKIYDSLSREHKESENGCNVLIDIMFCYARSLKFGCANVYQSLPRLLSIWLNFTSSLASMTEGVQPSSSQASKYILLQGLARKMNELISNCATNLPASIFFTALSQLLSRICHPSPEVFKNIKNIVMKLIEQFPQQSLWMLLPVFKSCHNTRVKRCRTIFTDPYLNKPSFQKLLNDFNMLAERLIELTNKDLATDRTHELSTLVRQLPRLFLDRQFSKIMLPFEKYMQASFPITSSSDSLNFRSERDGNSSVPSNPFPSYVYICGISEEVVVLRSAAKPKKITIECNDGLFYNVMIKPKDDLRKDFRLMEFNGLVKRFLHQDPQARHRRLRIRTYAAIPFNEECGLVEWLPNLNTFRAICMSFYRMKNLGIPDKMLRQYALPKTETIEKKRAVFNNILLARHPAVFHEWFRQRFPSPHCWYQARSSFVKTVAVMSMVGYILGLGDRHGENILLDETNGDAVHVDFNCLFNQGEMFAFPEVVPFRLTHNMVFAMGPLGVEGLFRKCCEISLRVLKGETKTLMSVLKPFVYDIGSINRLKGKTNTALEMTDPKAITDVKRIEERLQGYVKRTSGCNMPLSTEGHVNFLINEATAIDNLSAMYIGWGAFI